MRDECDCISHHQSQQKAQAIKPELLKAKFLYARSMKLEQGIWITEAN